MKSRDKLYEHLFYLSENWYRKNFKRKRTAWNISMEKLKLFKHHELGFHYYNFLATNNLHILPKLETHDMFHVLTQTNTEVKHEIALQFYLLGNGKRSFYQFMVLLFSIGYLEKMPLFYKAYRKGKQSLPFHHLNYEKLLHQDISAFIQQYNIQPFTNTTQL